MNVLMLNLHNSVKSDLSDSFKQKHMGALLDAGVLCKQGQKMREDEVII